MGDLLSTTASVDYEHHEELNKRLILEELRNLKAENQALKSQLSDKNKLIEAIFEDTLAGWWDWDIPSNEEYLSPALKAHFGYADHEMPNSPDSWQNLVHHDDLPRIIERFNRHVDSQGQVPFTTEVRYFHRDGSIKWIQCKGKVIEWGNSGEPIRMVGCHMDVTALKEQQLRAMESEARFRALFDHANIGMCLVGPEQQTILVNQTLQSLLQYSEEELSALSLSELTHPSDQHRDQQLFRQLTSGEIPSYQTEKRYIRKDGQILWVHLSVSLVKDVYTHKPLYAIGVIRDISARKRTEQDLSKASNELEQYVYLASHDLQEPLKNILSLSATLNEEYMDKLPEEALTMLNYIQASSIRMSALISDLLNYSRIGSKKASAQIDLKQLIHNALDDLQLSIKEKKAQIILPEVIPVVSGYETDLRLLFQNLFSNALKYSKADVPPVIELKIHKIMGFWEFCLTDNGIGIDPKYHDKIFAPFKRLHNNRTFKGTGIGLAHCKKVVELHGGLIRVESMPDKGSRFIFSLQDVADHHLNHSF